MEAAAPENSTPRPEMLAVLRGDQPWHLEQGDSIEVLRSMPDASVDAVVTDPPYGLSEHTDIQTMVRYWFVGKEFDNKSSGYLGMDWDSFVPGPELWREVKRVLKPGGHLLAFSGSRTMDLMGIAIRFAGFEMRDTVLAWVYGIGKPKTLDISKGIDSYAGAERKIIGTYTRRSGGYHIDGDGEEIEINVTEPATPEAKYWNGWGTGLKPGFEPVLVARKPLAASMTVVENVLTHRTGGMNIGGCRVGGGRWPMNVLLSHHPACEEGGECRPECSTVVLEAQVSGVAEFFPQFYYNGKATKDDRYAYVECGCPEVRVVPMVEAAELCRATPTGQLCARCGKPMTYDRHPTVKPTSVMRWLIRLVVPKGGLVLDPFNGSGSTGVAALIEHCRYLGVERDAKYYAIASKRLEDTAADSLPFENPPPLRGIDEMGVPDDPDTLPPPSSAELRRAFDFTEDVHISKPVSANLKTADFKRLVAKGLKRK